MIFFDAIINVLAKGNLNYFHQGKILRLHGYVMHLFISFTHRLACIYECSHSNIYCIKKEIVKWSKKKSKSTQIRRLFINPKEAFDSLRTYQLKWKIRYKFYQILQSFKNTFTVFELKLFFKYRFLTPFSESW
jgi:hypothetical protein